MVNTRIFSVRFRQVHSFHFAKVWVTISPSDSTWFNFTRTFRQVFRSRQVSISAIDYFAKFTKGKEIVGEMENIGEIETWRNFHNWRNRVLPTWSRLQSPLRFHSFMYTVLHCPFASPLAWFVSVPLKQSTPVPLGKWPCIKPSEKTIAWQLIQFNMSSAIISRPNSKSDSVIQTSLVQLSIAYLLQIVVYFISQSKYKRKFNMHTGD